MIDKQYNTTTPLIMSSQHVPRHGADSGRERIAPAGPSRYSQTLVSKIQRRLDEASLAQEELGSQREKLLIQREKVRSSGNQLRAQRLKAGDAEATFMSTLRRFFNEKRERLPPELEAAYNEVETARDALGAMEEDYLQAERTLSGLEWTFTEKESDVYQFELHELFSNLLVVDDSPPNEAHHASHEDPVSPLPEPLPSASNLNEEYEMARAELEHLRGKFSELREEQSKKINMQKLPEVQDPDAILYPNVLPGDDLLWRLVASEVKVQRLKQLIMPRDEISMLLNRRMSDPLHSRSPVPLPFDDHATAHTESAVQTLYNDPVTQQKTVEWLLDCLSSNAVQRTVYNKTPSNLDMTDIQDTLQGSTSPPGTGKQSQHLRQFSPGSNKSWTSNMHCASNNPAVDYHGSTSAPITQHETGEERTYREQSIPPPENDQPVWSPSAQPAKTLQEFAVQVPTVTFKPINRNHWEYWPPNAAPPPPPPNLAPISPAGRLQQFVQPGCHEDIPTHRRASFMSDGYPQSETRRTDTLGYCLTLNRYQRYALPTGFSISQKSPGVVFCDSSPEAVAASGRPYSTP